MIRPFMKDQFRSDFSREQGYVAVPVVHGENDTVDNPRQFRFRARHILGRYNKPRRRATSIPPYPRAAMSKCRRYL